MKKVIKKLKEFYVNYRLTIQEKKWGTNLLYYSKQISCFMFCICYILILKYTPELLSKVIHVRTYVNNPELDIYMNLHALFLIMILVSIYIALRPIEKRSDYE